MIARFLMVLTLVSVPAVFGDPSLELADHFDPVLAAVVDEQGQVDYAGLKARRDGLDLVLEQNDMCSGTSAISSRLIHGGLRYLEFGEITLVHESLRERITLRQIAAHLVRPIRICIPIYESAKRGPLLIRLGMLAYDLLSVGKTVPAHDMLSRDEAIDIEPGLEQEGLLHRL